MEIKWIIKPAIDKKICESFPEYSPLILQLLYNRGLTDEKNIDEFFNPDYIDHIHDPFLLKGMSEAVNRIERAIEKKEKILIYGDYDADGVTATALMIKTLKFLKAENLEVYIPDRAKEGYGLKKEVIPKIKALGVSLIITVDCGIASRQEVDTAKKEGMDVIVTDHHWVPDQVPEALAIINPKQKDDNYPFKDLAGVGVAFKLAQGLLSAQDDKKNNNGEKSGRSFEKWLLDLVAIGTVADSVPLLGENRTLLNYGLIVLGKTKNIGLKELLNKLSQKSTRVNGNANLKISAGIISFQLAPRINAAGRLDHANASFELLNTDSEKEARGLAESLDLLNGQRQKITEKIIAEAREKIKTKPQRKIIFEGSPDWPIGILGLVAGKLSDEFSRPVFIFNRNEKFSTASCRSIPSFNIIEALSQCREALEEFGGHKSAAGFKVKNTNIKKLENKLEKMAEEKINAENLIPGLEIDAEIKIGDVNWDFFREMEKMAPFGEMNPEPVFSLRKMRVMEMQAVGNGEKHLKLGLLPAEDSRKKNKKLFKAIGFNFGEWTNKIKLNDIIDIVFTLSANEWNGNSNIELKVVDLKKTSV